MDIDKIMLILLSEAKTKTASPAAGLFNGKEARDHFTASSPALESSFLGCWEDNIDEIPPDGSVFLATAAVMATLSGEKKSFVILLNLHEKH